MARKLTPAVAPKANNLKKLIERSLEDDKAQDISVIALRGKSDIADYMIIASGTSTRHIGAMAEHLARKIGESRLCTFSTEGMTQCNWVVVDTPYVVVHLFLPEMRGMYNLEKMWSADFSDSGHAVQL